MSTPTNGKSGKLLLLGVIAIGLAAAAVSWWFRYSATHQAAKFWGPEAATLIRDAAHVTLRSNKPSVDEQGGDEPDVPRDISSAKGLTHLRNALLEDASYDWSSTKAPDTDWSKSLAFEQSAGAEPRCVILFSPDFHWAANGSSGDPAKHAVATVDFFAEGLKTFFAEQAQDSPAE